MQYYYVTSVKKTLDRIRDKNWSVYRAAKEYGVPWSTLKQYIMWEAEVVTLPKTGRLLVLAKEQENKVLSYIGTIIQDVAYNFSNYRKQESCI